jgi:hypothetical protein
MRTELTLNSPDIQSDLLAREVVLLEWRRGR